MKKILSAAIAATVALTSLPASASDEITTSGHKIRIIKKIENNKIFIVPACITWMKGMAWIFAAEWDHTAPTNFFAIDPNNPRRIWLMRVEGTLAKNTPIKSLIYSIDAHCDSWTYDCLSSDAYADYFCKGQHLGSASQHYRQIPYPGTVVETAMKLACPKQ